MRDSDALKDLRVAKMHATTFQRSRLVATEACRMACNGPDFVERVRRDLGLILEILSRRKPRRSSPFPAARRCSTEACDHRARVRYRRRVLGTDLAGYRQAAGGPRARPRSMGARTRSMPPGASQRGRRCLSAWCRWPRGSADDTSSAPISRRWSTGSANCCNPFEAQHGFRTRIVEDRVHFLGTSGTVTTVAGIKLRLPR